MKGPEKAFSRLFIVLASYHEVHASLRLILLSWCAGKGVTNLMRQGCPAHQLLQGGGLGASYERGRWLLSAAHLAPGAIPMSLPSPPWRVAGASHVHWAVGEGCEDWGTALRFGAKLM